MFGVREGLKGLEYHLQYSESYPKSLYSNSHELRPLDAFCSCPVRSVRILCVNISQWFFFIKSWQRLISNLDHIPNTSFPDFVIFFIWVFWPNSAITEGRKLCSERV